MKIAIVAPPWIPVPPQKYGGIETVVWNLVEALHELGEEVILFGARESKVSCKFYPYTTSPLYFGMDSTEDEKVFVRELGLKYAFARAGYEKVDVIHDHTLFGSSIQVPTLHTVHSAATEGSVKQCFDLSQNGHNYLAAVSNRQKEFYAALNPKINFVEVVHHGINMKEIEWANKKEDFFLCVGQASWERGIDAVLRVAIKAKIGLMLAIKMIEEKEKGFFRKEFEPLIQKYPDDLFFQLHADLPRDTLFDLFRRAKCTLFTSQWEQPFGLVMVESMACGTPVITFRRGAASEIVVDGKTGFIVNSEDEMVQAIKKIDMISPDDCREHAEKNFSREIMAKKYLDIYKRIISQK